MSLETFALICAATWLSIIWLGWKVEQVRKGYRHADDSREWDGQL